ncbi:hypothetical protein GGF31_005759 [Allomyces arbusculus]|nr:hypothetical protein GGF31_005759 [Allomyces arbusculus]
MVVANLGSLAYKGWLLPYPSGAYSVEIALAVLQLPIEMLRLLFGSKGNLLESIPPLAVYFVLSLLTPLLSAFFMAWQTYVLAVDQWIHAVYLALSGIQFLMGVNLTVQLDNLIDEEPEMGFMSAITTLLSRFRSRKASLLVVGLDNAGKSTIVQYYKPESSRLTKSLQLSGSTYGPACFQHRDQVDTSLTHLPRQIDRFTRDHVQLTVFDMSGSARYRDLWPYYAAETDAVLFVIDAADKTRIECARRELLDVLHNSELKVRKCPFLFLCNKCDLGDTMPAAEVAAILGLDAFKDRSWYICECSALTGQGLSEGMAWLIEQLSVAR